MRFEFEDDDLRRLYEEPKLRHASARTLTSSRPYRKKMGLIAGAESELEPTELQGASSREAGRGTLRPTLDYVSTDQWRLILRIETDKAGPPCSSSSRSSDYH